MLAWFKKRKRDKMRNAVKANLRRQRGGRETWAAAIDADIAAVMSKITQLANDPSSPNSREPNVRELMNAMNTLRQTTSHLAATADDAEARQVADLPA